MVCTCRMLLTDAQAACHHTLRRPPAVSVFGWCLAYLWPLAPQSKEAAKGRYWFLETDLKSGTAIRMDKTGKSILMLLRHLGRLQEVSGAEAEANLDRPMIWHAMMALDQVPSGCTSNTPFCNISIAMH